MKVIEMVQAYMYKKEPLVIEYYTKKHNVKAYICDGEEFMEMQEKPNTRAWKIAFRRVSAFEIGITEDMHRVLYIKTYDTSPDIWTKDIPF